MRAAFRDAPGFWEIAVVRLAAATQITVTCNAL
jgi:hypothetical protein